MGFYSIFLSIMTLFVVGLIGLISIKAKIINEAMTDNIPRFIMNVTLPALILVSMQLPFEKEKLIDIPRMFLVMAIMYLIQMIVGGLIGKLLSCNNKDRGIYQFMMMFSNSAFMGFPVMMSIFGQEAVFYAALANLPFNILVFTVGVYMLDSRSTSINFRNLVSPAMVATITGIVFYIFSIKIPNLIAEPLIIIGNLTTPLSMVFIGASLTNVKISSIFFNKKLYLISILRLIVIPVSLILIIQNLSLSLIVKGVPVIISAMPVATFCAILAKEHDGNINLASQGIFMTTLLSLFTIPIVVFIYCNI